MLDHKDSMISRLFAEQDQSLPADAFMTELGKRMEQQQRVRRVYKVLAIFACLILSTLCAPWVVQIASALIEFAAASITTIGPLLYVPLAWLIVGATVAGCSPVIYLWRTGRW